MPVEYEPIAGRYATLELDGRPCRLFFEEAGQGIPILCLHTAGADSRQYRHLMLDEAVTAHYRVIAFDMPWHGKSFPPPGYQDEEYRLTTDAYTGAILAVADALELDRPVLMGCSIGGRIVLDIAARHAGRFRALIGLQAADHQTPWYDASWLHRPDVHGGEICAAMISGLVAPQAPEVHRWETLWAYLQSGPGVFRGDLHFYREDSDYRDRTHLIDTAALPALPADRGVRLFLHPEDTIRTAGAIPGARVEIMPGLGHFPMAENPDAFRRHILPVLDEIRGA